jgi:hypothetical protein
MRIIIRRRKKVHRSQFKEAQEYLEKSTIRKPRGASFLDNFCWSGFSGMPVLFVVLACIIPPDDAFAVDLNPSVLKAFS